MQKIDPILQNKYNSNDKEVHHKDINVYVTSNWVSKYIKSKNWQNVKVRNKQLDNLSKFLDLSVVDILTRKESQWKYRKT